MNVGVVEQIQSTTTVTAFDDQINIRRDRESKAEFRIYDLGGRMVGSFGIQSADETISVPESLAAGVYTWQLISGSQTESGKFEVQ